MILAYQTVRGLRPFPGWDQGKHGKYRVSPVETTMSQAFKNTITNPVKYTRSRYRNVSRRRKLYPHFDDTGYFVPFKRNRIVLVSRIVEDAVDIAFGYAKGA